MDGLKITVVLASKQRYASNAEGPQSVLFTLLHALMVSSRSRRVGVLQLQSAWPLCKIVPRKVRILPVR